MQPLYRRTVLLMAMMLVLSGLGKTQTLRGTLIDADSGEPLIGANIFLKSDFSKGTQSDLDGNFELTIAQLPDTIWVSYIGYEDRWIPVNSITVKKQNTYKMSTAATVMEVITVKATKLVAREFTVEQIKKLDVWLNPAAKGDALLAVQSLPASTNTDESANISLRGSPASETGVFLNNVPLNDVVRFDQNNGIGQFSIFNTALIGSINVFPSNPPLEFGHATAGAVAIYTDDELPDNSHNLSLNLVGVSGMTSQQIGEKSAVVAYVNVNTEHGLKALNRSSLSDLKDFTTVDGGVYAIHRFTPELVLKVFNFSLLERYRYIVRSPSYEGLFSQQKNRNLSILNLTHRKGNWQWQLNQGFNISDADYQVGVNDIEIRKMDYHASWTGSYFWEKLSVKGGGSFDFYRQRNSGTYALYDYAYGEGHPIDNFAVTVKNSIPEVFGYGKYKLSEKWTLGGGVRWHPEMDDLKAYKSFQANLAFHPKEGQGLILSGGQYEQYTAPDGEGNQGGFVRSRQIALDYRWKKGPWEGNAAVYTKQNEREDRDNPIYGAEIYTQYRGKHVTASFSVASIDSRYEEEGISYATPYDMSYSIRSLLQYQFSSSLTISATLQLREGRYFRPVVEATEHPWLVDIFEPVYAAKADGERFPVYHRLDMSASRMIPTSFGTFILYLNVNNLLDVKNVRYENYNQDYTEAYWEYLSRRSIFFGGVWQF